MVIQAQGQQQDVRVKEEELGWTTSMSKGLMVIQTQRQAAWFKSWVCNLSIIKPVSSHLTSLNFSFFYCKGRRKNCKIFRHDVSP